MAYTNATFFIDVENGSDATRATISSVAVGSNGSGGVRFTKTAHGLVTGAVIDVTNTIDYNGAWKITVIDANSFDIDTATWLGTARTATVVPRGGSSKADAWKTITSGATSARHQAGDTIRFMASRDAQSIGNATWTSGSSTVTLAAAKTVTVANCETAWTAATNVTTTTSTANFKQGSASTSITPATAFTTGKIAHFATGALDLSAYQQISFWIRPSSTISAGTLKVSLCSDTAGAVPVNEFTINTSIPSFQWSAIVQDYGSALGSNINSIALYALVDPGTPTIFLDNIIVCKAPGNADELNHLTIIGKNTTGEPNWYPINAIDGTTITLGGYHATGLGSSDTAARPYRGGATETVTTYAINPIDLRKLNYNTSGFAINKTGADGSPITFSGGWDRTTMTTQSGDTWISGSHWYGQLFNLSSYTFIKSEKLGLAHMTGGFGSNGTHGNVELRFTGLVGCVQTQWSGLGKYFLDIDLGNVTNCQGSVFTWSSIHGKLRIKFGHMLGMTANALDGVSPPGGLELTGTRIGNNLNYGLNCTNSTSYGPGPLVANGVTFENNGSGDVNLNQGFFGPTPVFNGCTFNHATVKINFASFPGAWDRVFCHKYGGVADDHRHFALNWTAQTDSTVRHTASGVSWKLMPTSSTNCLSVSPAFVPLGRIAFAANLPVTISAWVRRTNTGITAGIKIPGGQIAGVPNEVCSLMTAAADVWEQVSLTFTPTEAGVLEVTGFAYGGTTYAAYFDDLAASQ